MEKEEAEKVLRDRLGMTAFRPGQWEIIQSALAGRDVMVVLPTGGGKSVCFQLLALLRDTLVLVVSPLIALMEDQVAGLRGKKVPAGCLHSMQSSQETEQVFQELRKGGAYVLYVSPERVASDYFRLDMRPFRIGLFAIDEAHCVSQWGHDFRPEYSQLSRLKTWRPDIPIMALTASATPLVLGEITKQLGMREAERHVYGFYRPNLYYQAIPCDNVVEKQRWLAQALRQTPEGRILIYAGTRKDCEEIAKKWNTRCYHAGMSTEERKTVQEAYGEGKIRILVATNAFGMGIDHPDVRLVVHYRIPANLDALYQEMGRAGRDGKESTCLMLYAAQDKGLQSHFIQRLENQNQKRIHWYRLRQLVDYAKLSRPYKECRHRSVLMYFDQRESVDMKCGHCDLCAPNSPRRISLSKITTTTSRYFQVVALPSSTVPPRVLSDLKDSLKKWRGKRARELEKPAYCILTNKTLEMIVSSVPQTLHDLEKVHGIGPQKIREFGSEILALTVPPS